MPDKDRPQDPHFAKHYLALAEQQLKCARETQYPVLREQHIRLAEGIALAKEKLTSE